MAEQPFPSCWLWSIGGFCKATWLCRETRSALTADTVGLWDSDGSFIPSACLCSLTPTFMQMAFLAVSLVFVEQRRPERQWLSTPAFLWDQRSGTVTTERMRIMNVLYAETVYSEIKIQGLPMIPLLICILYVLIGFHQLNPSLPHFPQLALFKSCLPILYPICVNQCAEETFHADTAVAIKTYWLD